MKNILYWYVKNDTTQGPCSIEEIIHLYKSGFITSSTLLTEANESQDDPTWTPLNSFLSKSQQNTDLLSTSSCWRNFVYCIENYGKFSGRARRSEYWSFQLFTWVIYTVITIIFQSSPAGGGVVTLSCFLFFFIPSLAVFCRRMHDVGKGGAGFYISVVICLLLPIVNFLLLFYLLHLTAKDSERGENQYGKSSKYING